MIKLPKELPQTEQSLKKQLAEANEEKGDLKMNLTAVFFETGAMLTPPKSQNGTNCGSGGSFQSYLTHSQGFLPFQPF